MGKLFSAFFLLIILEGNAFSKEVSAIICGNKNEGNEIELLLNDSIRLIHNNRELKVLEFGRDGKFSIEAQVKTGKHKWKYIFMSLNSNKCLGSKKEQLPRVVYYSTTLGKTHALECQCL